MYILHIETATNICSVAISLQGQVMATQERTEGMQHASMLTPMIEMLVQETGIEMKDLAAVSVSSGPGSYTGLRVGGATAKALCYSLGIPLLPVPTLMSLAAAAFARFPEAAFAMPMIDARRREVYTNIYDRSLQPQWSDSALILDEGWDAILSGLEGEIVFCGDGARKLTDADLEGVKSIWAPDIVCSATHHVQVAKDIETKKLAADPLFFVPDYLKPPNITQPGKVL